MDLLASAWFLAIIVAGVLMGAVGFLIEVARALEAGAGEDERA